MRFSLANSLLIGSLLFAISGCSSTGSRSYWPSFLSKSKTAAPTSALTNAPAAPTFAPPTTTPGTPMSAPATGVQQVAGNQPTGGSPYPTTPYPAPALPVSVAGNNAGYTPGAQPTAPNGGYMPAAMAANQGPANPYMTDPNQAPPSAQQYGAAPAAQAPYNAAGQPGVYTR
jgi:hypothetical protein